MAEEQGIEGLKKAVKTTLTLINQIEEASENGWQWTDALKFVDDISGIASVIQSVKQVGDEIKDLSEPEKIELNAYIQAEFDLPDDHVEAIVEKSLGTAISIWTLVDELKKSKGKV